MYSITEDIREKADKFEIARKDYIAEKTVFVDGQPGCGKTMLTPIVAALGRVELLTYAYELEHFCSLYYLGKITYDAVAAVIKIITDVQLYNRMMSREVNFRPSDISSVFRDSNPLRYIRRLFQKGDEIVPERIKRERPILNLMTHNLLPFSEPIFSALGKRVVFVESIRHPLYMIKQQALNMEHLNESARDFTIYVGYKGREVPYYTAGWEELFLRSNNLEKAIYSIERLTSMTENSKRLLSEKYNAQIITVPFERFVIDPWPYLEKIERALDTKVTVFTRRVMKKQRVPRKMYGQGIGLDIHKRRGWEPPKSSSEKEEFKIRRQFALERACADAIEVLDKLSADYEKRFLQPESK